MHTQVGELHVHHGGGWAQENDYTVHEGSLEEKTETRRSSSKLRTSDSQRTSELMTERLQMHRTSGRLRTSDVSDVRNPTDVRHPSSSSAKTPATRRQRSDFRTSEAQRTPDASFGRPNPTGRPTLPVCSSGPWAMYPLPLPLDYKYPFTTSFLGLAKIRTKLERALLIYLPLGDLTPSRDLLLLRERGFFCG